MSYVRWITGVSLGLVLVNGAAAQTGSGFVAMSDSEIRTQRVQAENHVKETKDLLSALVSVQADNKALAQVLQQLSEVTGVRMALGDAVLSDRHSVTVDLHEVALQDALRIILERTPISYRRIGNELVFGAKPKSWSNQGIVHGKIIHAKTKQPVPNATISVPGVTQRSVSTQADGTFRLELEAGTYTVTVRALGMAPETARVAVVAGKTVTVTIPVTPTTNVLSEVVVTGTVIATERRAIPNPITVITAQEIENRGVTRIEEFFRGEVPGVVAIDKGSGAYNEYLGEMSSSNIYSRGSSNLGHDQGNPGIIGVPTPLKTFIDGVEILDPSYLGTIDPQSIERIEIITGPQAATIYGSGAMGGVMQIFTKKAEAQEAPQVNLRLGYGMLENNFSSAKTPNHQHAISMTGGRGIEFGYSLNASYNYTGQWQPKLFSRRYGASLGVRHTTGPVVATASASITSGENGTHRYSAEFWDRMTLSGEWNYQGDKITNSVSQSSALTLSLNIDYSPKPSWTHRVTFGLSRNDQALVPFAPRFGTPRDTSFRTQSAEGRRISANYNTTIQPSHWGILSGTFTVGFNGSVADRATTAGCLAFLKSSALIPCPGESAVRATRPFTSQGWGGFGTWRIGLWEKFYTTLGLRIERSPAYGTQHKVDFTPTNGATVVFDVKDVTVKILGSFGSATRAPTPDMQEEQWEYLGINYEPSIVQAQYAAPHLTPEYSRGPQGGVELYFGSRGSLTVNRYDQRVTDLIQRSLRVDSTAYYSLSDPERIRYYAINQYQNVARIRQHGWEQTGSLHLGVVSLKGTYTWSDSRVLKVNRNAANASTYYDGMSFQLVPTHSGNLNVTYASGPTHVSWIVDYIGATLRRGNADLKLFEDTQRARLLHYLDRRRVTANTQYAQRGYVKSNINILRRMNDVIQFTVNVKNAMNDYRGDPEWRYPVLGRQTTMGVSIRTR